MEFTILSTVTVRSTNGEQLEITRPQLRSMLCVLLLHAGRRLSKEYFIDSLWGDEAPRDPHGALRSNTYILRKSLGLDERLQTGRNGYTLELRAEDMLDLRLFSDLTGQAQPERLAGNALTAARLLEQALAIWHDPPLADVPDTPAMQPLISELLEQRHAAQDALIDAKLDLGQHHELLPMLVSMTAAKPLRERQWEQLVLALYRCGRRAEALDAFGRARRMIVEQCGIEPGIALRRLQQQILTADPALEPAVWAANSGRAVTVPRERFLIPHQLPAPPPNFIGRRDKLRVLHDLLGGLSPNGSSPVVSVVCGAPGVGKTAFALHFAHQVSDRFPDGQIYVDLGAFGPPVDAMSTSQAIRSILDALGTSPPCDNAPATEANALRTALANRRILILIDNALNSAQVRSLLPATSQCMVIATSRMTLTGLVTSHSAHLTTLDVLPQPEATELLASRLAVTRIAVDDATLADISASCAGLPLALVMAATQVVCRPTVPLHVLAAHLRREETRLGALNGALGADGIRAVLSWSYERLNYAEAYMFRALGAQLRQGITVVGASRRARMSIVQAKRALDGLATANLIREFAPCKYKFNALMGTYAAEEALSPASAGFSSGAGSDGDRAVGNRARGADAVGYGHLRSVPSVRACQPGQGLCRGPHDWP